MWFFGPAFYLSHSFLIGKYLFLDAWRMRVNAGKTCICLLFREWRETGIIADVAAPDKEGRYRIAINPLTTAQKLAGLRPKLPLTADRGLRARTALDVRWQAAID